MEISLETLKEDFLQPGELCNRQAIVGSKFKLPIVNVEYSLSDVLVF